MVTAMVQMASTLKLQCMAEGVESKEVETILREIGCDEVQGYYYCRPLNADAIAKLFCQTAAVLSQ